MTREASDAAHQPPPDWLGCRVHFVGIGGIGMSALARLAASKGAVVSG